MSAAIRFFKIWALDRKSVTCKSPVRFGLPGGSAGHRCGSRLVLLSEFGTLEAGGSGLAPAFIGAIEAGIPVLTSVSPAFHAARPRFAAPRFVILPADLDGIEK